jgi:hypothetical protein
VHFTEHLSLTNASTFSWVIKGIAAAGQFVIVNADDDANNNTTLYYNAVGTITLYYFVAGSMKWGFFAPVGAITPGDTFTLIATKNGAVSSGYLNGAELPYTPGYRESYTLGNKTYSNPIYIGSNNRDVDGTGKYLAFLTYNRVLGLDEIAMISTSSADFGLRGVSGGGGNIVFVPATPSKNVNKLNTSNNLMLSVP